MQDSLTGQEIDGYIIGPLLGAGGMGEVYQAFPLDTTTPVAIKVLRGEYALDTDFQARFVREVRLMESLRHEHIIPIYRYGIYEDKMLYFTMRLINGASLAVLLKRRKFTPQSTWVILEQAAAALQFGHERSIVHRDVKPDNIFIEQYDTDPHVFLGDFGLGKMIGVDHTLTAEGAAVGTPEYMCPEGAMGERLDPRGDIYSLTVVAYEMLTGVLPFNESHSHLTAMAHITKPVPLPTLLRPDFPSALEDFLLHGLEKDREARFQTMREFAENYYQALMTLSPDERQTVYWVE